MFGKNLSRLFLFTLCKINFEVLLHEHEENWQTFLRLSGNIKKRNRFLPLQLTEDIARRTDVDKYAKKVSFSGFVNLFLYSVVIQKNSANFFISPLGIEYTGIAPVLSI